MQKGPTLTKLDNIIYPSSFNNGPRCSNNIARICHCNIMQSANTCRSGTKAQYRQIRVVPNSASGLVPKHNTDRSELCQTRRQHRRNLLTRRDQNYVRKTKKVKPQCSASRHEHSKRTFKLCKEDNDTVLQTVHE